MNLESLKPVLTLVRRHCFDCSLGEQSESVLANGPVPGISEIKSAPNSEHQWWLLLLALVLVIVCSGALVYCWKARRVYNGITPGKGEWVYRDEYPLIYWCYMGLFLVWDCDVIYVLITLVHQVLG